MEHAGESFACQGTNDLCEVVITAPDHDWLVSLCRDLVAERAAASAHVIHPVTSVYRWHGAVHEAIEARAFLRTRIAAVAALISFVTARHPYEVPNITAFIITHGNPAYLEWIREETNP